MVTISIFHFSPYDKILDMSKLRADDKLNVSKTLGFH